MARLNSVKMTYAINRTGEIVSIDNVDNGLECNCICIDCNGQLEAKQGAKNQWHFSHHKDNDAINCQWSGESELHIKVKEYLDRYKRLTVPIGFTNPTSLDIQFDEIQLEKSLRPTKRIPDVTGYCAGEKILIEVKVTHEVDQQKRIDYKKVNVSVIELDFSDFTFIDTRIIDQEIDLYFRNPICNWLTVAPVGDIASQFQEHEIAVTKELIVNNQNLLREAGAMVDYINSYRRRYEMSKSRIKDASERLEEVKNQIHHAKSERNEIIHSAAGLFNSTLDQLQRDHAVRLTAEFNENHRLLNAELNEINVVIKSKKDELAQIQHIIDQQDNKVNEIRKAEKQLNIEKNNFHQRELDWNKAAKANAVIKRHFMRLEPELRGMCRKGGIPWPFEGTLMEELSPSKDNAQ
tara:strand:- start:1606 stop:2826 length:1221 start_codon:yes stop_codon:yes gene_type:complete